MKGSGLGQMQHSMNNLFLESHKNKCQKSFTFLIKSLILSILKLL